MLSRILRLRSQVAQALLVDRRLQDDYDLRVDRLLPRYWKDVEPHLEPTSSRLVFNGSQLSIYKEGRYLVGVEHRKREDRYSFYIGDGVEELQKRAAADLVRRGLVSDVTNVSLEV